MNKYLSNSPLYNMFDGMKISPILKLLLKFLYIIQLSVSENLFSLVLQGASQTSIFVSISHWELAQKALILQYFCIKILQKMFKKHLKSRFQPVFGVGSTQTLVKIYNNGHNCDIFQEIKYLKSYLTLLIPVYVRDNFFLGHLGTILF